MKLIQFWVYRSHEFEGHHGIGVRPRDTYDVYVTMSQVQV